MTYILLDFETTIKEGFKRKPNQFYGINKIIVSSTRIQGRDKAMINYSRKGIDSVEALPFDDMEDVDLIVGHNVKFDLLFIWGEKRLQDWFRKGGKIWDTMVAEYLLTAQVETYASLNQVSKKYGGTQKDERLKEYWNLGIDTDQIDPDILLPYAEEDIDNVEIVYLKQFREAQRLGMVGLIEGYMDHVLATAEMEFNGLYVDRKKARDLRDQYQTKVDSLLESLGLQVDYMFDSLATKFNPEQGVHISGVLFNTWVKTERQVPVYDKNGRQAVYSAKAQKAGQLRWKKEVIGEFIDGFSLNRQLSTKVANRDTYTTDENTLVKLKDSTDIVAAKRFIETLLEYREARKFLSTYLYSIKFTKADKDRMLPGTETGLIPLIYPIDNCIHHQLDSVQTATGRLNSRNPNLQNVPKEVRQIFTSRFGENGRIISLDYNQLEIWVQAELSNCIQLKQDLRDGVDFHAKRLSYAEGLTYEEVTSLLLAQPDVWNPKRRAAKVVSFQKAYGASAESISKATGLSEETVKLIFDRERADYPEVDYFLGHIESEVKRSRIPVKGLIKIKDKDFSAVMGRVVYAPERPEESNGMGFSQSITGKRYHFNEYAVTSDNLRAFGNDPYRYFKRPELSNYQIQGTAADIMALSVGRVWRELNKRFRMHGEQTSFNGIISEIRMINEVHDELVLDIGWFPESWEVNEVIHFVKEILEDVKGTFKHYLNINFDVPLKVEAKIGLSWMGDKDE